MRDLEGELAIRAHGEAVLSLLPFLPEDRPQPDWWDSWAGVQVVQGTDGSALVDQDRWPS